MIDAESLTLTLAIGCLLALLSRRWVGAGVAGPLATACRPNAVALCARPWFVLAAFPLLVAVARGVDGDGSPPCRSAASRAGAGTPVSR
ncbi:MAG: hypothetical protein ACRDZ4_10615 [Egibacteraceae bacterium]